MAAFLSRNNPKIVQNLINKISPIHLVKRGSAIPPKQKVKKGFTKHRNLIKSTETSLASRGFLRSHKAYTPPADVEERLQSILPSELEKPFGSNEKYQLLNTCFKEFNHAVPNSLLCTIETPLDVIKFYKTPVSTTTPYEELKKAELPPNLHLVPHYVRFNPETDTMFGGVTAFPESSTLVTGLKYKDKYKGHKERLPVHYDNWSDFIRHDEYKP